MKTIDIMIDMVIRMVLPIIHMLNVYLKLVIVKLAMVYT